MVTAERAWIALGGIVITYEMMAPDGQLLSHAFDRWMIKHPAITVSAVAFTALHLVNVLPEAIDPYSGFGHPLLSAIKRSITHG